jgi:hypothetical protein
MKLHTGKESSDNFLNQNDIKQGEYLFLCSFLRWGKTGSTWHDNHQLQTMIRMMMMMMMMATKAVKQLVE